MGLPCREEKVFLLERRFLRLEKRSFSQGISITQLTLGDGAFPIGLGAFVLKSPGNALPGSFWLPHRMGILLCPHTSFPRPGIEPGDWIQRVQGVPSVWNPGLVDQWRIGDPPDHNKLVDRERKSGHELKNKTLFPGNCAPWPRTPWVKVPGFVGLVVRIPPIQGPYQVDLYSGPGVGARMEQYQTGNEVESHQRRDDRSYIQNSVRIKDI